MLALTDYTTNTWFASGVDLYFKAIQKNLGSDDADLIVLVSELLPVVACALQRG